MLLSVLYCLVPLISAKSNGWNDQIDWLESIDEAKQAAADNGKPIMLIIHKRFDYYFRFLM